MSNSNEDEELDDLASLPPEQLSDELARDIAKRWDPERLLKLVAARAGKGEQLDHSLRERYEQKLGVDLGHVRVFTGTFAEEFNRQRNADAVTIGGTGMILMGNSIDRSMATADGQALLAHELTHVAQAEKGVHRAGHGPDRVLASEEHEHEAREAEAEAAAEHKGEAATQGAGHAAHERGEAKKQNTDKLRSEIKEKVLEMLGEWGRVEEMRSGLPMRRP